jgi:hypothetical protein
MRRLDRAGEKETGAGLAGNLGKLLLGLHRHPFHMCTLPPFQLFVIVVSSNQGLKLSSLILP